jgi:hypothetical protein
VDRQSGGVHPTVDSRQRARATRISDSFDKTFLSNGFLITNMHFVAHLMDYHMRYYSTFFVDNATEKFRA